MPKDRLTQTKEAYEAVCELSKSAVLSHSTMSLVSELRARLEHEIAQMEAAATAYNR